MFELLILGEGFIGKYLAELLQKRQVSYAATTTDGRNNTIKWKFPDSASDPVDCSGLPAAKSILITFPLQGSAPASRLIKAYLEMLQSKQSQSLSNPQWIYLGSTRPFKEIPSTRFTKPNIAAGGPRVEAEELIINEYKGYVLNLAGLWGGERIPQNWSRFYQDTQKLRGRLNDRSLHLIHGADVALAIAEVVGTKQPSGRWLVADGHTHDMLEILLREQRLRDMLQELLDADAGVREMLGTDTVADVKLGESKVKMRIDPSHSWTDYQIRPKYPYRIGQPDPFDHF
ncbi:hypothetical protein GGI07_000113 [Coemansia sp. Benny D115]|nr:hypothetical protein GGI07_000113 [Coemansia sp. Benny D115]